MVLDLEINDGLLVVEDLDIELKFKIHVYDQNDKLVVTDIDWNHFLDDLYHFF